MSFQPYAARRVPVSGPPIPGNRKVWQIPNWGKMSDGQRIKYIRRLSRGWGRDPRVRNFAVKIYRAKGIKPRDYRGQAKALLEFTQRQIYYLNEPGEILQSPIFTLRKDVRSGDCDDIAILLASLAIASRLGVRFVLSGRSKTTGKMVRWIEGTPEPRNVKWAHIYVQIGWPAFNPTHWESAEGTLAGAPLGWDVTRSHMYPPIPGAPGVPLFPEMGGYGAIDAGSGQTPAAPPPSSVQVEVTQQAEEKVRADAQRKAFWASLDWAEIATATIPAVISGFFLFKMTQR
jgi:hypothetical protein